MKNIEKWLLKNGYKVNKIELVGRKQALKVDTNYDGPYPSKSQFDALETIRQHVSQHYSGMTVEPRGHYTAIFIY